MEKGNLKWLSNNGNEKIRDMVGWLINYVSKIFKDLHLSQFIFHFKLIDFGEQQKGWLMRNPEKAKKQ